MHGDTWMCSAKWNLPGPAAFSDCYTIPTNLLELLQYQDNCWPLVIAGLGYMSWGDMGSLTPAAYRGFSSGPYTLRGVALAALSRTPLKQPRR